MNTVLTARFDGRDEADLALMRLRRSGVRFEVLGLSFPETGDSYTQLGTDDP